MKTGGPAHWKVALLAKSLKIEQYAAVGLLECLWHWAAEYATTGEISRRKWEAAAAGCFWKKERLA
jgi:hypothetical protein